jgi:hypothetical protein
MKQYRSKKGISLLFVLGSYGGFHKTITKHSWHICLGWIAFTVFWYDVESALSKILIEEKPDEEYLDEKIKAATPNWKGVDADQFIKEIRE